MYDLDGYVFIFDLAVFPDAEQVVYSLEVGDHELFLDMGHEVGGFCHENFVETVQTDGEVIVFVYFHEFTDDVVECF